MRVAPKIVLTDEQHEELTRCARGRRTSVRLALRARIVLLAADDYKDQEIAAELEVTRRTAARWRSRFGKSGLAGIE